MSRFKELKRIEDAIKHRDKPQLNWAAGYCAMRLSIARRKDHQKYWSDFVKQVEKALDAQET
jgi:hypothetical protein